MKKDNRAKKLSLSPNDFLKISIPKLKVKKAEVCGATISGTDAESKIGDYLTHTEPSTSNKKDKMKTKLKLKYDLNKIRIFDHMEVSRGGSRLIREVARNQSTSKEPKSRNIFNFKTSLTTQQPNQAQQEIRCHTLSTTPSTKRKSPASGRIWKFPNTSVDKPLKYLSKITERKLMENKKNTSSNEKFVFNSLTSLNNYIIRDHKIGEGSKNKDKLELAVNFFKDRDAKKSFFRFIDNKANKLQVVNECDKTESFDGTEIDQEKIRTDTAKVIDMINNVSAKKLECKLTPRQEKEVVNPNSMRSVIRLRSILKHKFDPYSDQIDNEYRSFPNIKENLLHVQEGYRSVLCKVGPPSFLKTKFKKSTINKYNSINCNHFR